MGSDLYSVLQVRADDGTWGTVPIPPRLHDLDSGDPLWEVRSYVLWGVLAGHRDAEVTPIAAPRGLPEGIDPDDAPFGDLRRSWLTVAELLAYDWSATHPCHPGTLRQLTGAEAWLDLIAEIHPDPTRVRLVFGFD